MEELKTDVQPMYTRNNRKVIVISRVNSTEVIVQEIFIADDNQEYLSGEAFTVIESELFDKPCSSWKEKYDIMLEKYHQDYYKEEERQRDAIRKMANSLEKERDRLRLMKEQLALVNFDPKIDSGVEHQLHRIIDFLCNDLEWIVLEEYHPKIMKLSELELYWYDCWGHGRIDGIKLVSLFGKSNGDLEYRLNTYSDGSGGWTTIHPFRTYEEAFEKFTEILKNKSISDEVIKQAEECGIELDPDKLSEWAIKRIEGIDKDIANFENQTKGFKERKQQIGGYIKRQA